MKQLLVGCSILTFCIFCATPRVSAQIIISEVFPAPDTGPEWIELTNLNSEPLSLQNWSMWDAMSSPSLIYSFEADDLVPGLSSHVFYLNRPALNNNGDTVFLHNPDNEIVHTFSYTQGSKNLSWHQTYRDEPWSDHPTPFQYTTASNPTPLPLPSPSPSPTPLPSPSLEQVPQPNSLSFSEVLSCPPASQSEWVELYYNHSLDHPNVLLEVVDQSGNSWSQRVNLIAYSYIVLNLPSAFLNNSGDTLSIFDARETLLLQSTVPRCSSTISLNFLNNEWVNSGANTPNLPNNHQTLASPTPTATQIPSPNLSHAELPSLATTPNSDNQATLSTIPLPTPDQSSTIALENLPEPTIHFAQDSKESHMLNQTGPIKSGLSSQESQYKWPLISVILGGIMCAASGLFGVYVSRLFS